jgi:hypothetical protein
MHKRRENEIVHMNRGYYSTCTSSIIKGKIIRSKIIRCEFNKRTWGFTIHNCWKKNFFLGQSNNTHRTKWFSSPFLVHYILLYYYYYYYYYYCYCCMDIILWSAKKETNGEHIVFFYESLHCTNRYTHTYVSYTVYL